MEYIILIHKSEEGGYWSEVPSLPGCFSQGDTIEETIQQTREAIELHIAVLKEDHVDIPHDEEFIISTVKIDSVPA